jgi:hypothetical protein
MNTLTAAPAGSTATETDRTGLSRDALRRAFLDNLYCVQGKFPALATKHDYYMALAYTVRDRMLQRWISTAAAYTRRARAPWPTSRPSSCSGRTWPTTSSTWASRSRSSRPSGSWAELRGADRAGGGAGPGQRRAGAAGRLLPGFDGHAGDPVHRLRHPLRVRHLRAAPGRRLAGRADRQVAAQRQPLGTAAPRMGGGGQARRAHRAYIDLHGRSQVRWVPGRTVLGIPTTRRSSATATSPPTRCGCGAPRRRSPSTWAPSTAATTTARCSRRWCPRTSARSSTRTTSRCRARNCAWSSSSSSSAARCRTCCASCACSRSRWRSSTRSSRCSSTTPIRRWPSPS